MPLCLLRFPGWAVPWILPLLVALVPVPVPAAATDGDRLLLLASTTSTEQSGLFGHLLPRFRADTGVLVRVLAVGSGQALEIGRRGDADVLLVHAPEQEQKFIAAGHGLFRREVMYNDFIVVGPADDPAGISRGAPRDAIAAFRLMAHRQAPFISRGDNSGTHIMERRLWRLAGLDPGTAGPWLRKIGQGMGAALNMAAATGAYTLADRGTWLSFGNRRNLSILVSGDPHLFNQYSVIPVSPARHPHVRSRNALVFADWLSGVRGQAAINGYRLHGERLFTANAGHRTLPSSAGTAPAQAQEARAGTGPEGFRPR